MGEAFKPSQVVLVAPPLVGTLGHAEVEHVVALIVRTLQVGGDTWRAVDAKEIGAMLRAEIAADTQPIARLMTNPFFRPDIHAAVKCGAARWVSEVGGQVELVPDAIERLRSWVAPASGVASG